VTAAPVLFDGDTVSVWLVKPNLVFTRVHSALYTVAQAENFARAIWPRAREALGARRYVWVSDSRSIASYEPGSRLVLTRWSLDHRAEIDRIILLVSPLHTLVMAGVRVGRLANLAVGLPTFVESSPHSLLERHGIRWPGEL
jgi:hypothetical protein